MKDLFIVLYEGQDESEEGQTETSFLIDDQIYSSEQEAMRSVQDSAGDAFWERDEGGQLVQEFEDGFVYILKMKPPVIDSRLN